MAAGLLTTAYKAADAIPAPPAELILTVNANLGARHQLFVGGWAGVLRVNGGSCLEW